MLESTTIDTGIKVMSPTISQSLIQIENVSYTAGQRHILQDISFSLQPNEIVSVIGPNGAGKTSLVKLIVGIVEPTRGQIIRKDGLRIGYMPQNLALDPTFPLTVQRFLELGLHCSKDTFERLLKEIGITHVLNRPLQKVSGGELQRVLLARALSREPQLLVLDEPAQGVDLIGQGELYDLIAKIRDSHHCAVLLVSHDLNVVMAKTDNVVCLNQHVCCSGHPDMVSKDPAFTAMFGQVAKGLAFYTHRHDHHHDMAGDVVAPKGEHRHD
jgi:zinc transport system ATP-binding protein